MPTVELTCRKCGGERDDNLYCVATHGQRMPRVFCPYCGSPLTDSEGLTTTHGNASNGQRACLCGCDEMYTPAKPWQKYVDTKHRWQAYKARHAKG